MTTIAVRLELNDSITPGLERAARAGEDFTRPMAEISFAMLEHTQDRFEYEYDPDGVPWINSQAALKEGRRTLYKSGDLFRALSGDHGRDFAAVGVLATGGPARYARALHYGATIRPKRGSGARALNTPFGPRGSVTIPARPFVGIEVRDRTVAENVLIAHLRSAFGQDDNGSGGRARS